MLLFVLVVILITILNSAKPEEEIPHTYCGRTLANARMLLCYESMQKRAIDFPTIGKNSFSNEDKKMWPWTSSRFIQSRALALATRGKRNPGLVDECCFKPCYTNELLSYC